MFILVLCSLLLYRVTRGLGLLHLLAALAVNAAFIAVFVCGMMLAHKAHKRGMSPLVYAYGSYAVYAMVYGPFSLAPCVPSWMWVGAALCWRDTTTLLNGGLILSGVVCAVYLWGFYKKLARAFGRDDAFARRLYFLYPLALAELAFHGRYAMTCRGIADPRPETNH